MSTNEEGRLSNGSAAPSPPATDEVTRCAIALPGADLEAFSMPDAQARVQQDWYTQAERAANRALEDAQSKASSAPVVYATTAAAPITAPVGAYATPLAQQAPFLRSGAVDYEASELRTGAAHAPAPTVAGPSERQGPYSLPSQGTGDVDLPLSIGSHPYAARPGSMRRRRVGGFLEPGPGDTVQHASVGQETAVSSTGNPDRNHFGPAWKDKDRICAYCKTENWARRTFCYQCKYDFATGWWHRDDCKCGKC
jgi:hypothetical protein